MVSILPTVDFNSDGGSCRLRTGLKPPSVHLQLERLYGRANSPLRRSKKESDRCGSPVTLRLSGMKVMLVFDPKYGAREESDLGDAFWLIESPDNRALATKAWTTNASDPNSAVFKPEEGLSLSDQALAKFADIDLHHPGWTEVAFVAVPLTADFDQRISGGGFRLLTGPFGFSVLR